MASNKSDDLQLSITDQQGKSWTLDVATRKWELSKQGQTVSGKDPTHLDFELETALNKNLAPTAPAGENENINPENKREPDRLAVFIKRPDALVQPNQSSNLEVLKVFDHTTHPGYPPVYIDSSGERVWPYDRSGLMLDPQRQEDGRDLSYRALHYMVSAKLGQAAIKPMRDALRQWWRAKDPSIDPDTTTPANQVISTLWPTSEPSTAPWKSDGQGGARLGKATISINPSPRRAPYLSLSYEGMGEVMSLHPDMLDSLFKLGAVMHALFDKSVPDAGVKTWVARSGWEKSRKNIDRPVQAEVAAATLLEIPRRGGATVKETVLLSRATDGSWRWRPVPLERASQMPDVRVVDPSDAQFLAHVRALEAAANAAYVGDAPWSTRHAASLAEQTPLPELAFAPGASPEELIATTSAWIKQLDELVDAHPNMVAFRQTVAPIQDAMAQCLGNAPSAPTARKSPRSRPR